MDNSTLINAALNHRNFQAFVIEGLLGDDYLERHLYSYDSRHERIHVTPCDELIAMIKQNLISNFDDLKLAFSKYFESYPKDLYPALNFLGHGYKYDFCDWLKDYDVFDGCLHDALCCIFCKYEANLCDMFESELWDFTRPYQHDLYLPCYVQGMLDDRVFDLVSNFFYDTNPRADIFNTGLSISYLNAYLNPEQFYENWLNVSDFYSLFSDILEPKLTPEYVRETLCEVGFYCDESSFLRAHENEPWFISQINRLIFSDDCNAIPKISDFLLDNGVEFEDCTN